MDRCELFVQSERPHHPRPCVRSCNYNDCTKPSPLRGADPPPTTLRVFQVLIVVRVCKHQAQTRRGRPRLLIACSEWKKRSSGAVPKCSTRAKWWCRKNQEYSNAPEFLGIFTFPAPRRLRMRYLFVVLHHETAALLPVVYSESAFIYHFLKL